MVGCDHASMHVCNVKHPAMLQRAERAALACESAAQELEKASVEMDKAAEVTRSAQRLIASFV